MIVTKTCKVKINWKNNEYYKSKGYEFKGKGHGQIIEVDIDDHMGGGKNAPRVMVICDYCGKEYEELYSKIKDLRQKTVIPKDACGECGGIKALECYKQKYGNEYPKEFIEKARQTNIDRYGVEWNMQREEIKEKYLYGENNPAYTEHENYSETRKRERCNIWKRKLLRKNKECEICGSKEKLECHHIDNFKDFEEKRHDINNGAVLCKSCHLDFHMKYGFFKTTIKEYNLWLNEVRCRDYPDGE